MSANWISNPRERRQAARRGFLAGLLIGLACGLGAFEFERHTLRAPIVLEVTEQCGPSVQTSAHELDEAHTPLDAGSHESAAPRQPEAQRSRSPANSRA